MVKDAVLSEKARIQRAYREANRKMNAKYGLQLKLWRISHKLNQTELGARLGMSQPAMSQWETGSNPINMERIERMWPELLEALKEVPS